MLFSPASEALSQHPIVKKVKLADLGRPDCNLLRAGVTQETSSQKKQAIAVFYDSRVGTHSECLAILGVKQIWQRLAKYEVLLIDLAEQTPEDIKASQNFIKGQLSIDLDKVARKTNPSIFLQANDTLHKVKVENLQSVQKFQAFADKVSNVRVAGTVKDLVVALKQNNTELDSLTIVYYNNSEGKTAARMELEQRALRLLSHES